MSATTIAGLRREVAALRSLVVPPPAPPSPLETARLAGFDRLDGWQAEALSSPAKQQLWLCGRQVGKSTTASLLALHTAVSAPASTTVVVSPTLRRSQLLYAKVRSMHGALGAAVPAMAEESALRFVLGNGAQVVALPGARHTIRGYTADLVIEDEAARVEDEVFAAVVPMLATTGGPLALLSSPAGKRGHFHALWAGGDPAWARVKLTSYDVARIDRGWLEQQRRTLPDHEFRQEFLAEFVDQADQVFRGEDIAAAITPGLVPLFAEGADHAA